MCTRLNASGYTASFGAFSIVVITASRGWVPFLPLLNMSWTVLTPPTSLHCEIMEVVVMRSPAPWGGWGAGLCAKRPQLNTRVHVCSCAHCVRYNQIGLHSAPSAAPHTHDQPLFSLGASRPCAWLIIQRYKDFTFVTCHVTWLWNVRVAEPDVIVRTMNEDIKKECEKWQMAS